MVAKLAIYFIFFCLAKKTKHCPNTLEVNGDITHDPKLIAQQFGNHSSIIALKIVKNNPSSTSAI